MCLTRVHMNLWQVHVRCSFAEMCDLAARFTACTDDINPTYFSSMPTRWNSSGAECRGTCSSSRSLRSWLDQISSHLHLPFVISPSINSSDLSIWTRVQRTIAVCFATVRQIRSVRRSLLSTALQSDWLPDIPLPLWHSSSFYCLLLFIVSLTFLPMDAYLLLLPTPWLFVWHTIVSVGDRPCSRNKFPRDVHCFPVTDWLSSPAHISYISILTPWHWRLL